MANEEILRNVHGEDEKRKNREYYLAYEELNERQHMLQQQIAQQQALLHAQEKELNDNRQRLKQEQMRHEKELMIEARERESIYEERERELLLRRQNLEAQLRDQKNELNAFMEHKEKEIAEKENRLEIAYIELQQEKEKYTEENRKQIEIKSQDYVITALTGLESKENSFHWLAKMWSFIGAISIVCGVLFMVVSTFYGLENFHNVQIFSWTYFLYILFRGLVVITMFIALARYAFIFSNSYMHESLKNSERRHAINFGKFYLEAYGANASWDQVKEAFQHWNISTDSAFTKKNTSDFDPKMMENIMELSKALSKNVNGKKVDFEAGSKA
ncbi:hypothetical protein AB2359_17275 [Vibrio cholerae]|uniref:hypothetical protein n=2 Tax=Vibrionaceae TaxID=641 RepID=UPI001483A581|nr:MULTISPECIES: hypothetical protein [Vibrio]EGR0744094.1 hypothetical protein [Vibrio cholerae]EGR0757127.1 hypothetical protein [Vibrio cholerae]EGR0820988.1 hypothetical protein [Vibrio cholerae]EJM7234082.1 hypothetical protein [Vibrio cholerae]NNN44651.1 hypothetical protein [Vibrio sp. 1-1(7)]